MKVREESENTGLKLNIQKNKDHVIWFHHFMTNRWVTMETVTDFIFLGSKIIADGNCSLEIKKTLAPWKRNYDQPRQHIKKQRLYFANKGPSSHCYDFSSSHMWMWELDYKESWAPKNCCFWTVALEKTLESPLDCKEIQPVHPKGNQSWIFIGRTDTEADTLLLWPPDVKNWLIWKEPDARKDWSQEEKGTTEDEIVGWHHWLNGHEFEQAWGVGDGQGGLSCCSPWGHKELDMIELLNWTESFANFVYIFKKLVLNILIISINFKPLFHFFSSALILVFSFLLSLGLVCSFHRSFRCKASLAAAKSLQSCLTLCNPIDCSPPGCSIPGILQARTLEWVDISFSNAWKWTVKVKSLSHVRLSATPWTAAYQAPPSMEFSKQEYWSGSPVPYPLGVKINCLFAIIFGVIYVDICYYYLLS